jgi:hypothetical protein
MGKYAPLGEFLRQQDEDVVPMTFAEIERVTGTKLPPSASRRAWWSNNATNSVMTKVWLEAGFRTEQVDMSARKLVFRRLRGFAEPTEPPPRPAANSKGAKRHPLLGALKGFVWVAPGTDLTKPADPQWGKRAYGRK